MDEVLAELAAVVACGDAGDTVTAGGADPGGHGAPHVLQRQTVGDDLEDTGDVVGQGGLHGAAQSRAVGRVGRGAKLLVLRPDLAAAAHDTAREREDDSGDLPDRLRGPLGRRESDLGGPPEDKEVPAGHRLAHSEAVFDQELAVHHRDAPETALPRRWRRAPARRQEGAVDDLAHLVAVAEEAQERADAHRLLGREIVEAGGGRGGHHALSDASHQLILEDVRRAGERQDAHAGPPVGGALGRGAFEARLAPAPDDGRREAGHGARGDRRPALARGRNHEAGRAHREGLGVGVLDERAGDLHVRFASVAAVAPATGHRPPQAR